MLPSQRGTWFWEEAGQRDRSMEPAASLKWARLSS